MESTSLLLRTWRLEVLPGPLLIARSDLKGRGMLQAVAGQPTRIVLGLRDRFGNASVELPAEQVRPLFKLTAQYAEAPPREAPPEPPRRTAPLISPLRKPVRLPQHSPQRASSPARTPRTVASIITPISPTLRRSPLVAPDARGGGLLASAPAAPAPAAPAPPPANPKADPSAHVERLNGRTLGAPLEVPFEIEIGPEIGTYAVR